MLETVMKAWLALQTVLVLAMLVALLLWAGVSFGAEMTTGDWFKSLRQPGTGMSCCDESDCRFIEDDQWRVGAEGYEVILHGQWTPVPPDKVLNRPDGPQRAALCAMQTIFCFRPGTLS